MVDPQRLTPESFLEELRERTDTLRTLGVEVPPELDSSVLDVVSSSENPFQHELFRLAAVHLLDGLDPEMADADGGADVLTERLWSLPANLNRSLRLAAERHEQHV